jgi:WD40 repeat protein
MPTDRPALHRPTNLAPGAPSLVLSVTSRGVLLRTAAGLVAQDWGAPAPSWSLHQPCRHAAVDGRLSVAALLAPDGVRLHSLPSLAARTPVAPRVAAPCRVALDEDGQRLAIASEEGEVELIDLATGASQFLVDLGEPLHALAFAPGRPRLLCGLGPRLDRRGAGALVALDLATGEVASRVALPWAACALAFSPSGVIVAGPRGVALLPDGEQAPRLLPEQPGWVTSIAACPARAEVAVGYRGGPLALWHLPGPSSPGSLAATLDGHAEDVLSLAYFSRGAGLCSASADLTLRLWEPPAPASRLTLALGSPGALCLAPGPGPGLVLSGHQNGSIHVWDTVADQLSLAMGPHRGPVYGVASASDGRLLASAGEDGSVRLWSTRGAPRQSFAVGSQAQSVAFLPEGRGIAVATALGVDLFPLPAATRGALGAIATRAFAAPKATFRERDAGPNPPDTHAIACGPRLVVSGDDRGVIVLRSLAGEPLVRLAGPDRKVWSLALSADGETLAAGGAEGAVRVFRLGPGGPGEPLDLRGHEARIWAVAISPDGQTLASASEDGTVRLWPLIGGEPAVLRAHAAGVTGVAWDPSGRTLLSASRDGAIVAWRPAPRASGVLGAPWWVVVSSGSHVFS